MIQSQNTLWSPIAQNSFPTRICWTFSLITIFKTPSDIMQQYQKSTDNIFPNVTLSMLDRVWGAWIPAVAAKENISLQCKSGRGAEHSTAQLGAGQYDREQYEQHSTTHSKTITERGNIFLHADLGLRRWEGGVTKKRICDRSSSSTQKHTHNTDGPQSEKRKTERDKDGSVGMSFCRYSGLK